MKDNKKTIQVLVILTILFTVMGGTLAYWNWQSLESQKTNVVFSVNKDFSCAADGGGNISHTDVSLAPTTCTDTQRAIKRKVTVKPTLNKDNMTLSLDLWININELGEGLKKSNNFKYVLTTSSTSCEAGTILSEGNFKGRKSGDKIRLITNDLHTETPTPEEYYLYIWLDAAETSSSTMNQKFNLSLGGECEEVETLVGDAYAIYTNDKVLHFIRSEEEPEEGDTYKGATISAVYSGIEEDTYEAYARPWEELATGASVSDMSLVFEDTIRPISTAHWFEGFYNRFANINLSKLDTSQAEDLSYMFAETCNTLDVSTFDTSKATDISYIFSETASCVNPDIQLTGLENWDTSNVTDMVGLFANGTYKEVSGLDNWDTSKVISMADLFLVAGGGGVRSNLSNWNVSNVTNMYWMFANNVIGSLGLENWDVSNVTNMQGMFADAYFNTNINLGSWDVSNVTDMSSAFSHAVINANIGMENWNVSKVTNVSGMFYRATISTNINLSNWNVSSVINHNDFNTGISGGGTVTPPTFK